VIEAVASGKIQGIEELITKKISIDNIIEQGFQSLIHDKDHQSESSLLLSVDQY
jgi:hypothetical protein